VSRHHLLLAAAVTDATFARTTVDGQVAWVGKCLHCGKKLVVRDDGRAMGAATLEHVWPTAQGGTNEVENLAVACESCNVEKGARHDHGRHAQRLDQVTALLRERRRTRWRDPASVGMAGRLASLLEPAADPVIRPAAWRAQPWRNGRGVTHEVARWPADADDYALRISVAEVTAPGAFSIFPGYDRWTVLLDGGTLGLSSVDGGVDHWLVRPRACVQLAGEIALIAAIPDGAVRVLNVLGRRGTCEVAVERAAAAGSVVFALADCPALGLARWCARVLDAPARGDDLVVIRGDLG
jgi:uncharacterized protein